MKKVPFLVPFIVAMVVLPYFSCKTAQPATQAPAKPEAKPATSAELTAAIARAEEARQKAIDFEGPAYFPSDWEAAEKQFTDAKHTAEQGSESVRMALDAYNGAADAFDALFKLAIPLYAQAKEDEILTMRDNLIAAGIRDAEPDFFVAADETSLKAYEQYQSEDYYGARDTANQSIMMYQTLENAYEALLARHEIEEMNFQSYGPESFDTAGDTLSEAMDAYEDGDIATAHEKAGKSLELYNEVLIAGWTAYAEYRSSLADAERQAALDIKAHIATRERFSQADSSFKTGTSAFEAQHYKEAASQFINSETLFIIASTEATEKRRNASDMIREANEKIEESDETARQAEIILEGGAK